MLGPLRPVLRARIVRTPVELPWLPDHEKIARIASADHALVHAALDTAGPLAGWRPDVVHGHDWEIGWAADTLAALAICNQVEGRPDEAQAAIRALREYAEESGSPELRTVAGSCEARLAVWRGDLEPAVRWQRAFREPVDFPSFLFWLEVPAL